MDKERRVVLDRRLTGRIHAIGKGNQKNEEGGLKWAEC